MATGAAETATAWAVGGGRAAADIFAHGPGHEAAGALGPLGLALGPIGIALGANQLGEGVHHGDVNEAAQGALGVAGGVGGTAQGVASLAAGAGVEGAAGVAAAGGTVAAAAAAGAAGLAAGHGLATAADSQAAAQTGLFGTDPDTGKNRTAMDAAGAAGVATDKAVSNFFGNETAGGIAGGIAAGASAIPLGLFGAGAAAGTKIADWLGFGPNSEPTGAHTEPAQ